MLRNEAAGSISGATWVNNVNYVNDYLLDFDGVDDYVVWDTRLPFQDFSTNYTVAVTVNWDSVSSDQVIYNASDGTFDNLTAFGTSLDNDAELGINYRVGGTVNSQSVSNVFTTDTNYRVAIGFDFGNKAVQVHINGEPKTTDGTNPSRAKDRDEMWFGASRPTTEYAMDGGLDNPTFYSGLLTDSEAQSDYNDQPWS